MARKAGRLLGDIRALEEQHNLPQSNPVGFGEMRGGSATPSMGLSQFRGGNDMARVVGGRKGGRNNKEEEAHRMGRALSLHLNKLHGAGYAKAFAHGCSGGGFFDDLKRTFENVGQKIGNEFTNPSSVLRGRVLPEVSKYASYAAPVLDVAGTAVGLPGAGTMLSRGLAVAEGANKGAKALGYGRKRGAGRERDDVAMLRGMGRNSESSSESSESDSESDEEMKGGQSFANPSSMAMSGAYQGQGRKKRASAGPNDGRRKRAEVVKKVMAEKGMKMIEASKYVKEHGLY